MTRCELCDRDDCHYEKIGDDSTCMSNGSCSCPSCIAWKDCNAHRVDWRARALAAEAEARDMMLQKNQNAVALHECIRELNAERLVTSGCVEKEVETRTIERVAAWLDSMISPDDGSAFYVSIRETARRDLLRQLAAALRNNTWRAP